MIFPKRIDIIVNGVFQMIDTCISLKTVSTISPTTPSCLSSLGTQNVVNLHYRITDNFVAEIQQHLVNLCQGVAKVFVQTNQHHYNWCIQQQQKSSPCITIIPTIRPMTQSLLSSLGTQGAENIRKTDRFHDAILCVKLCESVQLFCLTKQKGRHLNARPMIIIVIIIYLYRQSTNKSH